MERSEIRGATLREIIAPFEAEVLSKVETLYPDEGERTIVNEILIPQFRILLGGVIPEGIVLPGELPVVCDALDRAIEDNKGLLDTEGLFQPLLREIKKLRIQIAAIVKENNLENARAVLRDHGITDRATLLELGAKGFQASDFSSYGKGNGLAGKILGRAVKNISIEILEEIADALAFKKDSEAETRQKYREALRVHGIVDRRTLLEFGVNSYLQTDFTPYGKGYAFVSKILGRTVRPITVEILEEVAETLGLEQLAEETKQKYREALRAHGITDRATLLGLGAKRFRVSDFSPYGKGNSFAGNILGRGVRSISIDILEEIADALAFQKDSEAETRQKYREALRAHGIVDRRTLLELGVSRYWQTDFTPYGKGYAFMKKILGRSVLPITVEILEEVAERLGLEQVSEETKQKYQEALRAHGIVDRRTLLEFGVNRYPQTDFTPYGQGCAFVKKILGRVVQPITVEILEEVAETLGLEQLAEGTKQKYCEALRAHEVTDRTTLMDFGLGRFETTDFTPYGKGKAFVRKILGRGVRSISIEILEEIADALAFKKDSVAETREKYYEALRAHGVTDRTTLLDFGLGRFQTTDFTPYGKGYAFAKKILGRSVHSITVEILEEIADELALRKDSEAEMKQKYREALRTNGIVDRETLLRYGVLGFTNSDFSPYGKGGAFAGRILGRHVKCITTEVLEEIAKKLELEQISEETKQKCREALERFEITDRMTLLRFGVLNFKSGDFSPFGKGYSFARTILGRSVDINIRVLEEIADALYPSQNLGANPRKRRDSPRRLMPHPMSFVMERAPEENLFQERYIV